MKKLILVRHGETDHNNERVFQSDETSLNETGRRQVESLVEDLAVEKINIIMHSPLQRAAESADILHRQLNCPAVRLDLLVEFMNPPEIRGASYDDPAADQKYRSWVSKLQLERSLGDPEVENYYDLYRRSGRILAELSSRPEDVVLAVSHSETIKAVVLYTILGAQAKSEQIAYSIKSLKLRNARAVTLIYDEQQGRWRVLL